MSWREVNNQLVNDYAFPDFRTALAFVVQVGALAEQHQHHPDVLIHDYCHVRLTLVTHEAGAVTTKDHELAQKIDELSRSDFSKA